MRHDRYQARAMENRRVKERRAPGDSARLEALLDKLVAIRMELGPACQAADVPHEISSAITESCNIVNSAISDLRHIIGQAHDAKGPPG